MPKRRWRCRGDGSLHSQGLGVMTRSELVCQPPPPCPPPPAVMAPGRSCSCNRTSSPPEICQAGQLCQAGCLSPVLCPDPTRQEDWPGRHARVVSGLTNSFSRGSWLEVECLEHRFTPEGGLSFRTVCGGEEGGEGGTWNMSSCTIPDCTQVRLDAETEKVTDLFTACLKARTCRDFPDLSSKMDRRGFMDNFDQVNAVVGDTFQYFCNMEGGRGS